MRMYSFQYSSNIRVNFRDANNSFQSCKRCVFFFLKIPPCHFKDNILYYCVTIPVYRPL